MSTELAKLVVRLEAQSAQYDASLKKATRELNKFRTQTGTALTKIEKQFKSFGTNIARSFGIASLTAAVYGLTRSVGSAIKAGDDLAKFASKTGLTAEAATELAHAAKMSDIELTSFALGIKKMQVEISKAGSSAKGTSPALAALGLTFEKLDALNPDQKFELIAEQISQLKSPADKTRAAVELFGKAGADLLPMFEQGAEGIRAARQEAIDLGKSLSAMDLKKLQEADDAIKRMSASLGALGSQAALVASGPITALLDGIRRSLGGTTEEEKLTDRVKTLGVNVMSLGKEINSPLGIKLVEDYAAALDALTDFKIARSAGVALPEFDAPGFAPEVAKIKDGIKELQPVLVTATKIFQDFNQMLKDTETDVQSAGRAYDVFKIKLQELQTAGLISAAEFDNRMREFIDKTIPEVQVTAQRMVVEQEINKMSVYAEQAARNMQDHFADFLFDPFDNGIKGMLASFVDTLRRMLANAMAADIFKALGMQPGSTSGILGFLSGGIGALFGGGGGGGGAGVPMLAAGGPVTRGNPYIVGEQGPELIVPGASGTVIPNDALGGVTLAVTYNTDARGATADLVKALPALFQENNRRLMESLRDARSRGQF